MRSKKLLAILLVICMIFGCMAPAAAAGQANSGIVSASSTGSNHMRDHVNNGGNKNVASGSEASQGDVSADVSAIGSYAANGSTNTDTESDWAAKLLGDVDVDLLKGNDSLSELKALSAEYEATECVTAFVVLEEEPLAVSYSSLLQVPNSVLTKFEKAQEYAVSAIRSVIDKADTLNVVHKFKFLTNAIVVETEFENLSKIAGLENVASVFISPIFYPASTTVDKMTVSSGQMTNVDDVWNLNDSGYTGAGMTIAVLDTGLDLDHPSFRDAPEMTDTSWTREYVQSLLDAHSDSDDLASLLNAVDRYKGTLTADDVYYSAKVPFIFNYALGNTNVSHNDSVGDHGTHVAGIAAANEVEGTGVVGMAPDAQLIAMKVFNSTTGGATLSDFVAALEDCILLGVDVANLSLGSAAGFSSSSYVEIDAIFDRIADTGMIVNIAAGNEGTSAQGSTYGEGKALTSSIDNSTVASPSTYANVMSIASVDNEYVMGDYFSLSDGSKVFFQPSVELLYGYTNIGLQEVYGGQTLEYVVLDKLGSPEDFYAEDGTSLVEGKVAVIRRGSINFGAKVNNAYAAGAIAAIIWNNNDTDDIFTFGMSTEVDGTYPSIPAILISQKDGNAMAEAEDKTMTVVVTPALRINSTGGQVSSFSSWGVSADLRLLPDLSGIGGNVYSCYDGGEYGIMSGTSMATPQVCGVTALVKQYLVENKITTTLSVRELVQALLMSTARVITDSESNVETSPRQQGAGVVDALNAVSAEAYLTVNGARPKAELGDSTTGTYSFSFKVHNFGSESKTYTLSSSLLCEDYVTSVYYSGVEYMAGYDRALSGTVSFSSETVTVAPGGSETVNVTITLSEQDKSWINTHFENGNYVEGYVYLTNTAEGGVDLSLPFMGFYQNWNKAPVFDSGFWYDNSFWSYNGVEGLNATITGEEYWFVPWLNMGVSDNDWLLGMNPYAGVTGDANGNVYYSPDNNVISPNGDGIMDYISDYYISMLRNARFVWLTYTDENGNVLHQYALPYESKTMYNSNYDTTVPTVYSWYYPSSDLYDFTDANGDPLPDGTKLTLTVSAVIDYNLDGKVSMEEDGNIVPVKADDYFEIPITIDTAKPVLDTSAIQEVINGDNRYLYFTFTEAHPATVALMNPGGTQIYDQAYDYNLTDNGDGTYSVLLDITGHGDDFMIVLGDYGYNEAYYSVSRKTSGGNDPKVDSTALYAYQVYDLGIYYYYGWDYMFGWTTVNTDMSSSDMVTMINSDAKEYYAINAAEYVDGYIFAVDAGNNFLYMKPGLWNRTTICNLGYNVVDMAFDDVTDTMYLLIADEDNENGTLCGLATVDLLTGEVVVLRNYYNKYYMPWAMTFVDGHLYCCKYGSQGLYEVELGGYYPITAVTDADGNAVVPSLSNGYALCPYYAQSMTYSENDGLIYWTYCDSSVSSMLVAIDPEDWSVSIKGLGSTEYVGVLTLEDTEYEIPAASEVTELRISEESVSLAMGASAQLSVYALPWNAPAANFTWTSSDPSVATVDATGKVTGVSEGTATVTATCGDVYAVCEVNVVNISGTFRAFNYSGDGDYGYWQNIDLATMTGTDIEGTMGVEFMAADYNGHDGYIYGYDSNSAMAYKLDPATGDYTQLKGSSSSIADMAYDYTTGIMYAISYHSMTMYAMNMYSGKLLEVGDIRADVPFRTLACDLYGTLYGIDCNGGLWKLYVVEGNGDDGDGDDGIGGWDPLFKALSATYDIDDGFGFDGEEDEDFGLVVEAEYVMEVPYNSDSDYGQSMCYDHFNDVLLWCNTNLDTFYWLKLPVPNEYGIPEGGLAYNLGTVDKHAYPQYLGMHVVPDADMIPELDDVYVSEISSENLFLLVGDTAVPSVEIEPLNVNQQYDLVYKVTMNDAEDGSDDDVVFINEKGEIEASKAGVAYVDIYAIKAGLTFDSIDDLTNDDVLGATCIQVTVKNPTTSTMRAYSYSADVWLNLDQYDTNDPSLLGSIVYGGNYYTLTAAEYVASENLIYGYGDNPEDWTGCRQMIVFNPDTMSVVSMTDMGNEFPFVYDMAFDYTTGTMYALAGTSSVIALYYVDLTDGSLIKACSPSESFFNITFDANGTLYGMTSGFGALYTIDPKTGSTTWVMDTAYNPYMSSMSYDYATGYIYWTPYGSLYLIDLKDYSCNCVGDLSGETHALMLLTDNYPTVPNEIKDAVMTSSYEEINTGESIALKLLVQPPTAVTSTTWTSSDTSIATVDENGVVTGVSAGTVTITATVTDGVNVVRSTCTILVYDAQNYFIAYNVTDGGFSAINRTNTTTVTNLSEADTAAPVTAMVMIDGVIYAYDEDGNFFTTTAESGFTRNYVGSCGIDCSEYDAFEEDAEVERELNAYFTIRDMTVTAEGRVLAIGCVGYHVYAQYFYNGEIYAESDYLDELRGGNKLYEVNTATGELTELCVLYHDSGDLMSGANMLQATADGRVFIYNTFNDHIGVLNVEDGTNYYMASLQSINVRGEAYYTMGMTYDEGTNSIYLLLTSDGTTYRMFKMDVATCMINELGYVGDSGDTFHGLVINTVTAPVNPDPTPDPDPDPAPHVHYYTEVYQAPTCVATGYHGYICSCGDILSMDILTATGKHDYMTNNRGELVCIHCGRVQSTELPDVPITPVKPTVLPFTDVKSGDWYYNAISYVYGEGLMNGVSTTTFDPEGNVTRAMVVQTLYRMAGMPKTYGSNSFTDLTDSWYQDAVQWAYENGITTGRSDSIFDPNASVTREELASFVYRFADYCGYDMRGGADLSDYADIAELSTWAESSMSWANAKNLIGGRSSSVLAPKGTATRAELATILMRFCENIAK